MSNNRRLKHLVATLCALLGAGVMVNCHADSNHYVNMLVGDRAAGMGGAYTAISDDPSGLYYNPAGIVYSPGSSLSGSMNSYQQSSVTYKNVLGGTHDWTRKSGSLLPNFFGVVQPLGGGMVGFSYAVPNSIEEDQDQSFAGITTALGDAEFIINFNNSDNTYNYGPSYAYKISDSLAIGGTLYFQYRHQQRISNTVLLYSGDRVWINDYFELDEYGVKPVLGVMWSPAKQWSLGMSMSKVSVIGSTLTTHQTCLGANSSSYSATALCQAGNIVTHQVTETDEEGRYPFNVNLGAAWFASDALLLSADVSYYDAVEAGAESRDSVVNIALGSEYYINPRWAMRAGFYTDNANTPQLQENFTAYNQNEHVDLYGISASISHFTRSSSLTLGFSYSSGEGKAQIISGSSALQDVSMENFGVSLAASYSY